MQNEDRSKNEKTADYLIAGMAIGIIIATIGYHRVIKKNAVFVYNF